MMNLYIITGPPGVGKTTVSLRLGKTLGRSAVIRGDDVHHMIVKGHDLNSDGCATYIFKCSV